MSIIINQWRCFCKVFVKNIRQKFSNCFPLLSSVDQSKLTIELIFYSFFLDCIRIIYRLKLLRSITLSLMSDLWCWRNLSTWKMFDSVNFYIVSKVKMRLKKTTNENKLFSISSSYLIKHRFYGYPCQSDITLHQ